MSLGSTIEEKVEEARLAGKSPGHIGLTQENMDKLVAEFRAMEKYEEPESNLKVFIMGEEVKPYRVITEFLHLPVCIEVGPHMPVDGIYIHDLRTGYGS